MLIMPLDLTGSRWIAKKNYPTEVAPRTPESFHISDLPTFKQEAKRMRGADTFADRVRFLFIKAYVQTDDGRRFRVKLSSDIRQVWSGGFTDDTKNGRR
jgi:hypothetical protein